MGGTPGPLFASLGLSPNWRRNFDSLSEPFGQPLASQNFLHFPRNLVSDFTHYLSEQPEMSSPGEKSRKAKTTKGNHTYENKIS